MNKSLVTLLPILTTAVLGFGSSVAQAASIRLFDGTTMPTINDNGVGDLDPSTGSINHTASLGIWRFNILTGITKPILGSNESPSMSLNVAAKSTAAGTLTIWFSEVGFGPSGLSVRASDVGNARGSETYRTFQATNNVLFSEGTLLTAQTFSTGGFGGDANGSLASGASPYSLTQKVTITHSAGTGTNTSNANALLNVPDGGASVTLLGFALVAVEGLRRRFSGRR
jgi:hypothetical protein